MRSPRTLISTGSAFERSMGYSRAVVQGDWCFVSGVTGYDYETMQIPENVADQTRNCFETIGKVLTEAGFGMADIARVQYTLVDRALAPELLPIVEHYLGEVRPAATIVMVDLLEEAMLIEIEVTAFRG